MKIDSSKLSVQNSPENKSLEEEPLEEESPKELPTKEEYWIETKLLSTTYFHLKLHLTLPKVMMILNHKPSKNVDVEMIGQCRKRQFRQN
jgi:hypothetical protein